MTENKRLEEVIKFLIDTKKVRNQQEFVEIVGSNKTDISLFKNGRKKIANNLFAKITGAFPCLSLEWLETGEGEMLKVSGNEEGTGHLIPFYDSVSTVGGTNLIAAEMGAVSSPAEYIDAGDWFRDATAAIRHYGESMVEYPQGCILAIRELKERQLIIWGRDYVIETSEYRLTKRVQRGIDDGWIRAYSTSTDTYPDGRLVHEPMDVEWRHIRRIFLVLGYVVKKNDGTIVHNNK